MRRDLAPAFVPKNKGEDSDAVPAARPVRTPPAGAPPRGLRRPRSPAPHCPLAPHARQRASCAARLARRPAVHQQSTSACPRAGDVVRHEPTAPTKSSRGPALPNRSRSRRLVGGSVPVGAWASAGRLRPLPTERWGLAAQQASWWARTRTRPGALPPRRAASGWWQGSQQGRRGDPRGRACAQMGSRAEAGALGFQGGALGKVP